MNVQEIRNPITKVIKALKAIILLGLLVMRVFPENNKEHKGTSEAIVMEETAESLQVY